MGDASVPAWVHFAAGATAGALGAAITCPLEVVKTRLQSSNSASFVSTLGPQASSTAYPFRSKTVLCLQDTFRKEGVRGLWRGLGPMLLGVVPSRSIYFATYNFTKRHLIDAGMQRDSPVLHLYSAISAGLATTTSTNPIWLIKTRLQLSRACGDSGKHGVLSSIADIARTEGIRGFYRGLFASYLGIAETSLQFIFYEQFKKRLGRNETIYGARALFLPCSYSASQYFMAAACAKFFACVICYPHEVLRTRMREAGSQVKYKSLIGSFREGVRGLYAGMTAHLLRVVPNAAFMFLTYELVVKAYALHRMHEQHSA